MAYAGGGSAHGGSVVAVDVTGELVGDADVDPVADGESPVGAFAADLSQRRENDEQRERHCHQCRYERNLRESHFYPPYGAVVLGLALSPRAGWSVIPLYPCPCAPRVLALRGMAGMLLSNDSRRPCNRMHRAVLAKPLDMSLRQHATLFLPASDAMCQCARVAYPAPCGIDSLSLEGEEGAPPLRGREGEGTAEAGRRESRSAANSPPKGTAP